MYYSVMEARYVANYTVWLRFKDGTEGEADIAPETLYELVRVAA